MLEKIAKALSRDRELPLRQKLVKVARYGVASVTAPYWLRHCDEVGQGARTQERPLIENFGRIVIGDRIILNSDFARVELRSLPGAKLTIGDDAAVNFGTRIIASESVTIGNHVSFGPYVTVADEPQRPIRIEDNVWLATRVTVQAGVTIGAGSVISAGSVVTSDIPPGAIAGGSPARVLQSRHAPPREAPAVAAEVKTDLHGLIAGDFSVQEFAFRLAQPNPLGPHLEVAAADFGQVVQTLLELQARPQDGLPDFVMVWTRPEETLHEFREQLFGRPANQEALFAEIDQLARLISETCANVKHVFVPLWTLPPGERGLGMIDLQANGLARTLLAANQRLLQALDRVPNVHVLDAQKWFAEVGKAAYSAKLWYRGKIPYSAALFAEAAEDVRAALRGLRGQARKLLVLDLDDTLWGGIVGDVGWENLRLGGHDAEGEAFVDFQHHVKALTRRGIILAVVSKNEEQTALDAIQRHPEMVLKSDDFSAHRINWRDKAQNIVELTQELNLGLQSVVFIDDNPIERARVREALPEVYVPEWPADKLAYVSALQRLRCFDTPVISREDAERTTLYAQEKRREALKTQVGSLDEWLQGLGTIVKLARLQPSNVARTTQLLNKTNQMNLATRRLSESELQAWAQGEGNELWTVTVSDKFGDAGLTGILGLRHEAGVTHITDYILSCRVMGRRVEETLVWLAYDRARTAGSQRLVANYLKTAKNKPTLSFLERSGLTAAGDTFSLELSAGYALPSVISVVGLSDDARSATHAAL